MRGYVLTETSKGRLKYLLEDQTMVSHEQKELTIKSKLQPT